MTTNVSAPLPDLNLEEQSILTIDTLDAAATIEQVVIHVSQDIPDLEQLQKVEPFVPLFVYRG